MRLVLLAVVCSLACLAMSYVIVPHPPRHIEWEVRDVGGYILCHPNPDSTDVRPCVRLPEGAQLSVPHWVRGPRPIPSPKES